MGSATHSSFLTPHSSFIIMPKYASLAQTQEALKRGDEHCESLVRYYLEQIQKHQELNVYVEVYAEEAMTQARALVLL